MREVMQPNRAESIKKSTLIVQEIARRCLAEERLLGNSRVIRKCAAALRKADRIAAHFGKR
jgi:hypothetical protein